MIHSLLMMLVMTLLAGLLSGCILWRTDRRLLSMALRSVGKYVAALALVGLVVWGLVAVDSWWLNVCWLLAQVPLVALLAVRRGKVGLQPWWLPLSAVWLLAVLLVGYGVMGCMGRFTTPGFVAVMAVLLAQTMPAVAAGLRVYQGSKQATWPHREYLLGNGATWLESLMPSLRRGVRAAWVAHLRSFSVVGVLMLPMLLSGQLLGGMSPVVATVVTLLLGVAALAVSLVVLLATVFVVERRSHKTLNNNQ